MVKNSGGNKSKRQGRKYVNAPQQRNVRYIKEEGEAYAVVTKLFGGSNCEVMCMDGQVRHCIIRNKFRGRDKRDNTITNNVWVLVGIREWETRIGKPQKCDLLEVYSQNDKEKIKSNSDNDISHLLSVSDDTTNNYDCDIEFVDDNTSIHHAELETEVNTKLVEDETSDEEIDIDEI
tara:strand:+ start:2051 stop:2581 length:531 start_codon:yes stop_codon:yes gene_type:complete